MDPRFDRLEVGLENGIVGRTSKKISVCTSEINSISSLVLRLTHPHLMGISDGDMEWEGSLSLQNMSPPNGAIRWGHERIL